MNTGPRIALAALLVASMPVVLAQPGLECIVTGNVRAADQPLEGASVSFVNAHNTAHTKTSKDGTYQLSVTEAIVGRINAEHRSGDGSRLLRMVRAVTPKPGTQLGVDFDLQPGTNTVFGVVTHNERPVQNGFALIVATLPDDTKYRSCAMTNDKGEYRLEGLPTGSHTLHLGARPTVLTFAAEYLVKSTRDIEVTLDGDQTVRHDLHLVTGELTTRLKGIGTRQAGRFVVIAGEFSGTRLTEKNVNIMLPNAVATNAIESDQTITVPDIEAGTYTVFFAVYDRRAANVRGAIGKMRVAYSIVSVEAGGEALVDLTVK